eukprot:gnl/MRDRNA2_/MRDRNA2_99305_c0_seq1.p1 gnl/MRDRNA2_/MRDRNA2_99305_c0~~gnl/MRDRNA2_/MRDRNA2_99305_c0_seq1.p1  ORF type:complete len:287 (-),score=69.82 gnl/MRDRNA2_/MRDRNA2_99305_c0_seq1:43-903(-)
MMLRVVVALFLLALEAYGQSQFLAVKPAVRRQFPTGILPKARGRLSPIKSFGPDGKFQGFQPPKKPEEYEISPLLQRVLDDLELYEKGELPPRTVKDAFRDEDADYPAFPQYDGSYDPDKLLKEMGFREDGTFDPQLLNKDILEDLVTPFPPTVDASYLGEMLEEQNPELKKEKEEVLKEEEEAQKAKAEELKAAIAAAGQVAPPAVEGPSGSYRANPNDPLASFKNRGDDKGPGSGDDLGLFTKVSSGISSLVVVALGFVAGSSAVLVVLRGRHYGTTCVEAFQV